MPFAPHHFICTQRIEMHGDKSNFTEPNFMAIFDIQHKESNFTAIYQIYTAMNRGATGSTNTQRDALKYLVTNQKTGQIKSPKTPYRRIEYAPNPVNQIPPRCFDIHRDKSNIHRDESRCYGVSYFQKYTTTPSTIERRTGERDSPQSLKKIHKRFSFFGRLFYLVLYSPSIYKPTQNYAPSFRSFLLGFSVFRTRPVFRKNHRTIHPRDESPTRLRLALLRRLLRQSLWGSLPT